MSSDNSEEALNEFKFLTQTEVPVLLSYTLKQSGPEESCREDIRKAMNGSAILGFVAWSAFFLFHARYR